MKIKVNRQRNRPFLGLCSPTPGKNSQTNILVIGLSYAFCGKSRLPEEFISENLNFVDFRQGICVYTSDQTSIGDLYAATKLQQL